MKKVSFKVAKAIKEAGYPQEGDYLYDNDGTFASKRDYESWGISTWNKIAMPTYLEVWLWLWREKHIAVEADYSCANDDWFDGGICGSKFNDPEKAIIAAIEYLVDNDLIK